MVDFQIASDLHLETRKAPYTDITLPVRRAPMLVLAGDIYPFSMQDHSEVLRKLAEPFDLVLYVPGNHEYYGVPFGAKTEKQAMDASHEGRMGKVLYMNHQSINVNGMQYIGATLWTNVPDDATRKMNDYESIPGFTVKKCREAHKSDRAYIIREVARAKRNGAVGAVIVTHHAPDRHLALEATNRGTEYIPYYYADDMVELVTDRFVKAWVHGHTHEAYRTKLSPDGPVIACNGLGYVNEETGYYAGDMMKLKIPDV